MNYVYTASLLMALTSIVASSGQAVSIPESSRNFLLDARVSGNVESFHKDLRGTPKNIVYDPTEREFARVSEYHEYGVGFGQDLGVVSEKKPLWWMAEWTKPVEANLIVLSGVYDNQPQPRTAWKIELRRGGKWGVHARGVGGWYDRGCYVWGGPGTPAITFDGLRVSVFSKDTRTRLKSVHFRGEPGLSWIVTYCPPIDAKLSLPSQNVRVGQPASFRGVPLHGKIRAWRWDFGDGTIADGLEVRHAFAKMGSYRIKLTFSDDEHRASCSGGITVMPAFRIRIKFRPRSVVVGKPIQFEGWTDNARIKQYEWDFGDGEAARDKVVRHAFDKPGVHRVNLRVSDGVYSDRCTTIVLVRGRQSADKIPVWIDTDIGGDIDDAVCLLLAARDPRIEIVGVSTVRGCIGAVDVAAWLCREILRRSGCSQTLVLPGAVASFSGRRASPKGVGSYGELAPPPAPLSPADDATRVKAIADAMRKVGKPFHLLTIGPLTNAALLVERYPNVAKHWLTVTCMAGQLRDEAECNVRLDPDAARIVCEKLCPRLVAMEAIGPAIPRKEADAALDPADPASAFLLKCYERYRSHAEWSGVPVERRPLTVFDPTALLSLLRPDAFEFRPVRLVVEKDGAFRLDESGSPVSYAFSSDWDILKPLIAAHLRGHAHAER